MVAINIKVITLMHIIYNLNFLPDTFENYATKTCQLLAVQELNQKGRETCRELIAQEGDNFI